MIEITVDETGIDEQIRQLDRFDSVSLKETQEAMKRSVLLLESRWAKVAAVDKGTYRQSLIGSGRVRTIAGSEIIGTVGTNITHRGVSYPAVLETSDKHHYRSGPRAGQKTAGKVKAVLKDSAKTITNFFAEAVEKIVKELKINAN